MGSGIWSTDIHEAARRHRGRTGADPFAYSRATFTRPRHDRTVHDRLNPYGVTRESRDSAEHPASRAIGVMIDVTGSMSALPGVMLGRLPQLHGLLQRKGYLAHPQLLFGAIGDATCDRVPLQVGQFESDNRQEEDMLRLFLEGGGGGQKTESYELALYFFARHTAIDCWERRRERGYLFLIGDEMPYPTVKPGEVRRLIGDALPAALPVAEIVRELERRYHVFYLLPRAASHGGDPEVLGAWRALLGQQALELDDPADICETIALAIGLTEGAISLDDGLGDLRDLGASAHTVRDVGLALRALPAGRAVTRPAVALPGLASMPDDPPRTRRL